MRWKHARDGAPSCWKVVRVDDYQIWTRTNGGAACGATRTKRLPGRAPEHSSRAEVQGRGCQLFFGVRCALYHFRLARVVWWRMLFGGPHASCWSYRHSCRRTVNVDRRVCAELRFGPPQINRYHIFAAVHLAEHAFRGGHPRTPAELSIKAHGMDGIHIMNSTLGDETPTPKPSIVGEHHRANTPSPPAQRDTAHTQD